MSAHRSRRKEFERAVVSFLQYGFSRRKTARLFDVDEQAIHYIRRKHGLPPIKYHGGRKPATKCKYGHRLAGPDDWYIVKRTGRHAERRCKECKREQNAARDRSATSKGNLIYWGKR